MENLQKLLTRATSDEVVTLSRLLNSSDGTIAGIAESFQRNASSAWGYHVRGRRPSYDGIVRDLALRLLPQSAISSSVDIEEIESRIVKHIWKTVWDKLSPQERTLFDQKLAQEALRWGKGATAAKLSSVGGGMLLAQTSGFGVYMLASSVLGALTTGIGVTLPFAAYTAVSSIISTVIGPAGWLGLGLLALHKLTGPNYNRIASAVAMVHCIRSRLRWEAEGVSGILCKRRSG